MVECLYKRKYQSKGNTVSIVSGFEAFCMECLHHKTCNLTYQTCPHKNYYKIAKHEYTEANLINPKTYKKPKTERIRELKRQGYNGTEIGEILKINKYLVYYYLNKMNKIPKKE